jgi:hypothetical protein
MPNVTEAEKALLDAVMSGTESEGVRLRVLMERVDPVLFENAVEAEIAKRKAEKLARATADAFVQKFGEIDQWDLRRKVTAEATARLGAK